MARDRFTSAVTAIVGASVISILYWYNKQSPVDEKYLITNIGALFWVPILIVMLFLRQEPSLFGFTPGDIGRGIRYSIILFVVVLPFLIIASRMHQFQSYYPLQPRIVYDAVYFGYFELAYGMYLFCWEFFFRGFLLFGLSRTIGFWAVFVQAATFGIMHMGKPAPEVAASFVAGVALGVVALRSRSFLPCFLAHWASAVLFDVLIIIGKKGSFF
ncbi:MAG: CPBP family intramembrane metalloprotease [Armatimonadetes bacterium]|nr:CPBP family intramembrane metalloprotease [Armatimonadota bacterium]